jgi:hypothetical protein
MLKCKHQCRCACSSEIRTCIINDAGRKAVLRKTTKTHVLFYVLKLNTNFTTCSIFSNSGHVGWCTASPDTILKLNTLVMIQTKYLTLGRNDQHIKICLPCNFEVNLITHLGVIALFSSNL